MIRGIYSAASGMTMNMQVVDVLAHNLANIATSGYKRKEPVTEAFGDLVVEMANQELGTTGTGVRISEIGRDERAGNLRHTGSPFDLGLTTAGQYFVAERKDKTRILTRDGAFLKNDQGELMTGAGELVLDSDRQPLFIKENIRNIKIREDGTIIGAEGEIGRILVVAPTPNQLLGFPLAVGELIQAEGASMRQGFLESSNVNVVAEMVALVEANRLFGMQQKVVSAHDQMLQKAANDLGRIQ